jgi:hypothetical protein
MLGLLAFICFQPIHVDADAWGGYLPNPAAPTQSLLWGIVAMVLLFTLVRRRTIAPAEECTSGD